MPTSTAPGVRRDPLRDCQPVDDGACNPTAAGAARLREPRPGATSGRDVMRRVDDPISGAMRAIDPWQAATKPGPCLVRVS